MYQLTQNIDSNKIFIRNRSELEGRIDPHQYHHERISVIHALKRKNKILKLKDVVKSAKKITTEINPTDIYVGLENIVSNTGEFIPTSAKETISSAGVFKKGDILFPKLRPYLNKVFLADFDGICSTEFHVFQANNISNEFLSIYLRSNIVVSQTKHLMTGNTLPRLQTEDINNLPVPDLSPATQTEIVGLYQKAFTEKQKKEAEAKELMKSTDVYLLNKLGILIPTYDYSLQGRVFTANLHDLTGSRFDPKLYGKNTQALKKSISKSIFPTTTLKKLIVQHSAGEWGQDENLELDNNYVKCLVIRATEFENQGNLKLDNSRVKYRLIYKDKLSKIDIQNNDLLIEKSGGSPDQPVGRVALITQEYITNNALCYSNFIHKIRINPNEVNPEYLFYFLKIMHNVKLTDSMQSQTNGIRNLIMSNYFNQTIVVPDMSIQNEIAAHIKAINVTATRLQAEANAVLESAKQEIEKMILG